MLMERKAQSTNKCSLSASTQQSLVLPVMSKAIRAFMVAFKKRFIFTQLLLGTSAHAGVSITQGKTTIPDGEATHAQDITVQNEHVAFALASHANSVGYCLRQVRKD